MQNGFDELRESVRSVLVKECTAKVLRVPPGDGARERDAHFWKLAKELGWMATAVPEECEGLGLGVLGAHALQFEFGARLVPGSFAPTLALSALLAAPRFRDSEGELLSRIAQGSAIVAACIATDIRRQDIAEVKLMNGSIGPLLGPPHASLAVVPMASSTGVDLALIEVDGDSARLEPTFSWDGTGSMSTLTCHNAPYRLVAAAGSCYRLQMAALLACDSVGGATEILSRTVEFMNQREQFGRPIATFQALKHRMANSRVALNDAGNLAEQAGEALHAESPSSVICVPLAKAVACDAYARIAADCLQLHGAVGYSWEYDCHLFLKRSRVNQAMVWSGPMARDEAFRQMAEASRSGHSVAEAIL